MRPRPAASAPACAGGRRPGGTGNGKEILARPWRLVPDTLRGRPRKVLLRSAEPRLGRYMPWKSAGLAQLLAPEHVELRRRSLVVRMLLETLRKWRPAKHRPASESVVVR